MTGGRGVGVAIRLRARSPAPKQALRVEALLESVRPVNPGSVTVSEGGPVVGFAPDKQAAGCLLNVITVGAMVLVFQTLTHDVVTYEVSQCLETENELAVSCLRNAVREQAIAQCPAKALWGSENEVPPCRVVRR